MIGAVPLARARQADIGPRARVAFAFAQPASHPRLAIARHHAGVTPLTKPRTIGRAPTHTILTTIADAAISIRPTVAISTLAVAVAVVTTRTITVGVTGNGDCTSARHALKPGGAIFVAVAGPSCAAGAARRAGGAVASAIAAELAGVALDICRARAVGAAAIASLAAVEAGGAIGGRGARPWSADVSAGAEAVGGADVVGAEEVWGTLAVGVAIALTRGATAGQAIVVGAGGAGAEGEAGSAIVSTAVDPGLASVLQIIAAMGGQANIGRGCPTEARPLVPQAFEARRAFAVVVAVALAGRTLASATVIGTSGRRAGAGQVAGATWSTAVDSQFSESPIVLVVVAMVGHANVGDVAEAEPETEVPGTDEPWRAFVGAVTVALAGAAIAAAAEVVSTVDVMDSTGTVGASVGATTAGAATIDGGFVAFFDAVSAVRGRADVVADRLVELGSDSDQARDACPRALVEVALTMAFATDAFDGF